MNIISKPAHPANYGGTRRPIQLVVIHVEAGTESAAISWFANPHAHVSAHYSVSKAGQVYSHVPENQVAWHAGIPAPCIWNVKDKNPLPGVNPNSYSIGIENEGYDDGKPWPDTQVQSLGALVADVCKRYKIPIDRKHIVGHHEIYAGHTCPGTACPWDGIITAALALT